MLTYIPYRRISQSVAEFRPMKPEISVRPPLEASGSFVQIPRNRYRYMVTTTITLIGALALILVLIHILAPMDTRSRSRFRTRVATPLRTEERWRAGVIFDRTTTATTTQHVRMHVYVCVYECVYV